MAYLVRSVAVHNVDSIEDFELKHKVVAHFGIHLCETHKETAVSSVAEDTYGAVAVIYFKADILRRTCKVVQLLVLI